MERSIWAALVVACLAGVAQAADKAPSAVAYKETPSLQAQVQKNALPGVGARVPGEPFVVDLKAKGRETGRQGGILRILLSKEKDVRLLNTWGYARLVAWTPKLELKPDLLKSVEVKDGRVFTFKLRAAHKWSDGKAFTSDDFRYFWEDVASNKELNPGGPPVEL